MSPDHLSGRKYLSTYSHLPPVRDGPTEHHLSGASRPNNCRYWETDPMVAQPRAQSRRAEGDRTVHGAEAETTAGQRSRDLREEQKLQPLPMGLRAPLCGPTAEASETGVHDQGAKSVFSRSALGRWQDEGAECGWDTVRSPSSSGPWTRFLYL